MLAFLLSTLESNEDKEIFTKIYVQYRPLMERTATRILKEPNDIEDAVQNAFVQIIRHFDKIYEIPREELPFWIISIVKNEALLIIRKSQKTVSLENWDGYVIESENVLDYTELVPREQVKTIIFRYIFIYYNRVRVYTRNPMGLPPAKYREWVQAQTAA